VQSTPNNADFDNALVPFAGSDGGKSVLYELVQTKPSTIICGLRYSFLRLRLIQVMTRRFRIDRASHLI
jgi:hypothetical protein